MEPPTKPQRDLDVGLGDFARRLGDLRARSGKSVQETQRLTGIPRSTVYAALSGSRLPGADVVVELAKAWGGDPNEWLLRRRQVEEEISSPHADRARPATVGERDAEGSGASTLAAVLKDLHAKAGKPSLRSLARSADTTASSVSRYLSGSTIPSWEYFHALLEALNATPEDRNAARAAWDRTFAARRAIQPRSLASGAIRQLFASAVSCAYPRCTVPLVTRIDGELKTLVEIAHIRPPAATRQAIDGFDNLILLCPSHHRLVDESREEDVPEKLLQWKARQAILSGQPIAPAVDLAAQAKSALRVEHPVRLALSIGIELVHIDPNQAEGLLLEEGTQGMATTRLCLTIHAENHGAEATAVEGAGMEFDLGSPPRWYYRIPSNRLESLAAGCAPLTLRPSEATNWYAPAQEVRAVFASIREQTGTTPTRVRPYVSMGPATPQHGAWTPTADLSQILAR
ncbi:helix-turn-helix domain-containing protein [Streptomyces sp. NBC_01546]|uniref:helix-turn-helix domain-containing protein n=1 Tax=Streptomyces sp. NBC_01546 TaxID=2975872 RepID=UPI002F9143A2